MVTCIIKDNGEAKVVRYTYEALWREIKDIPGAQIIVAESWIDALDNIKPTSQFVSFMEPDCLVSSGYFSSLIGLSKKQDDWRHIAFMSSATAVRVWVNKIFGYDLVDDSRDRAYPIVTDDSKSPHLVEIGYIPGALIRLKMLRRYLTEHEVPRELEDDLPMLSLKMSLGFWCQGIMNGIGERVYISPATTYATTDTSVNDIIKFDPMTTGADMDTLKSMFRSQQI